MDIFTDLIKLTTAFFADLCKNAPHQLRNLLADPDIRHLFAYLKPANLMRSSWFPVAMLSAALLFFYLKQKAWGIAFIGITAVLYLVYFLMPQFQSSWGGVIPFAVVLIGGAVVFIYLGLIHD